MMDFEELLKTFGMKDKKPTYVLMFGCALKMDSTGNHCAKGGECVNYRYCLAAVHRAGHSGWEARYI